MTNINTQYYVMVAENNDRQPLLAWGDARKPPLREVKEIETLHLKIAEPVPSEYEMADYHVLPRPVISQPLKDTLNKFELFDVQFLPATINTPSGVLNNYYLFHVHNLIKCLDIDKSDVIIDEELDDVEDIHSFMLDEKILSGIELDKRLIFILWEYPSIYICHESIKNEIDTQDYQGLRFIPINEWTDNINFN